MKLPTIALIVAILRVGPTLAAQQASLTVERIVGKPAVAGTSPLRPAWSSDSRWLAFLWNDRGEPQREIWIVARDSSRPHAITSAGVTEFGWTPDAGAVVFLREGDIWRVSLKGAAAERLTTEGGKSDIAVSPDGRFVSFRRAADLWLYSVADHRAVQATHVGVAPLGTQPLGTYYRPDAEIGSYVWGGPTYAWSPDGRWIAVHFADRRGERKTPFPYYLSDETSLNMLRRGYPGDSNEARTIGFYNVASGSLRLMDLPDPTANKINGFTWSPSGELLLDRESDTAVDRWLEIVDPATAARREIWHDHRESRVYTDSWSGWHPDGKRVLFVSDADDYYRLYLLTPREGASSPRPLTSGPYDIADPVPAAGSVYFTSTEPNPAERQVFRTGAEGGPAVKVTTRAGTYAPPVVSPDGQVLALLANDDVTPTELYLADARGGPAERPITHSPSPEFADYHWARPRYVTFPGPDGFTLHARIIEPTNLERTRRYPVVFGPVYSNTVRNRWGGQNGLLQQLLVQHGYIVVQVDVRGSTGYGRTFREKFLMDFAGGDLDDLESTVHYLKTFPYIDGTRMGIWGSSYGGTLTVYSLLRKPGLFQAGVAGAPATDPRFFGPDDVAITRRPQEHPEVFRRGAAQYAANLKDHLLIIHGMADDVVPFKTSVALAEELMRQGKDFDFAFAPAATHAWAQRDYYALYFYRKLVGYFDRYLGGGTASP
jgi:dipeptidyl-peptidase-4